jgi:hypothetical protein
MPKVRPSTGTAWAPTENAKVLSLSGPKSSSAEYSGVSSSASVYPDSSPCAVMAASRSGSVSLNRCAVYWLCTNAAVAPTETRLCQE